MIFNKDSCATVLKSMLAAQKRPVINYVQHNEKLPGTPPNQWRHIYRFFIINDAGLYNVSGAITAVFGVNVTDRSQTFSVNALSPEDDLKSFTEALRKFLDCPELILEDLILSAKETLQFIIDPAVFEFFPLLDFPEEELIKRTSIKPESANPSLPS